MKKDLGTRHGGRILADALVGHGAKLAFGVPGESYLPVLDGFYDVRERFKFIVCRQEGGASYMAEAYGKLTGQPGVLFVTRGPGATNGAVGVDTGASGHAEGSARHVKSATIAQPEMRIGTRSSRTTRSARHDN